MSTCDLTAARATAESLAREAGGILLEYFGRPLDVEYKGAVDLVTEADRASEAHLAAALAERYPDHAILAEEGSGSGRPAPYRWLVDPLDGTTNFAHGYPFFAVSIALEAAESGWERESRRRGPIVVGVVYDPTREELWSAVRGAGATRNGQPIRVSSVGRMDRALVATGFPYDVHERPEESLSLFGAFLPRTQAIRRDGSAALNLAYLADGRFDAFWERKLHAWDTAAASLLIEEAGGSISDFAGGPFDPFGETCAASNGHLHPALLQVLRDAGAATVPGPSRPATTKARS